MFSDITKERIKKFKKIKRAYYSLVILTFVFFISLISEVVANNKPLILHYGNRWYFPFLFFYSGKEFGQPQDSEVDYRKLLSKEEYNSGTENQSLQNKIVDVDVKNIFYPDFVLYPIYKSGPFESYLHQKTPPPHLPSSEHWLGTDRIGRDLLSRLLYGFRISMLFSLFIVIIMTLFGVIIGAIQAYIGGIVDIIVQRCIEIWSALPFLYVVILLGSLYGRTFALLIFIISLFEWIGLSYYMRAEFMKAKNMYYVQAAQALGLSHFKILFKHILPNSLTPLVTILPFSLLAGISTLTALDFLGFGLQPPTPSWGELLKQGLDVIQEFPHLTIITTSVVFTTLLLTTLVGEGVRSAFDPRSESRIE